MKKETTHPRESVTGPEETAENQTHQRVRENDHHEIKSRRACPVERGRLNLAQDAVLGLEFVHF
jgi:hypothetical protein